MASLDADGIVTSGGVRFLGQRRSYWRLLIRGAALLMITLGIYRFWLVTDVRRFLWSNTEIAGEALEYTGTALELLLGFLVAIALLIPIYVGFFLAALDLGLLGKLSGVLAFAALGVLGQYAIYRARRYRLTRTIYRGLRFHQTGSAWSYAFRATLWWIVTVLTVGLAYPFQIANLERYKMKNTFYGDLGGRFEASGLALFFRGVPMWLLFFAPLALAIRGFVGLDWQALIDAIAQGGDDVMCTRIALSKAAAVRSFCGTRSSHTMLVLRPRWTGRTACFRPKSVREVEAPTPSASARRRPTTAFRRGLLSPGAPRAAPVQVRPARHRRRALSHLRAR